MPDHSPDSIFALNLVRSSLLNLKRLLQVLLGLDRDVVLVNQIQSEISNEPQETREVLLDILVLGVLGLNLVGEVSNHTDVVQGILVDASHRVVHKIGGEQECKEQNLVIVGVALLSSPEALSVNDQNLFLLVLVLKLYGVLPKPQSLGTGVYRGGHFKGPRPIEHDPVQKQTLPRPVLTHYGKNPDRVLYSFQKHLGLLRNHEFLVLKVNERYCRHLSFLFRCQLAHSLVQIIFTLSF